MKTCITALFAATLWIATSPAAPVPTHLMPKPRFEFPTEVGTRWVYETDAVESVQQIVEATEADGGKRIVVAFEENDSRTAYFASREGFARLGSKPVELGEPFWIFRTAPRDFATWRWTSRFIIPKVIEANGSFEVEGVEKVTVPAGTFQCLRVAMRITLPTQDRITTWFATGVGKIREDHDGRIESLKSFERGDGKPKRPVGIGR